MGDKQCKPFNVKSEEDTVYRNIDEAQSSQNPGPE